MASLINHIEYGSIWAQWEMMCLVPINCYVKSSNLWDFFDKEFEINPSRDSGYKI